MYGALTLSLPFAPAVLAFLHSQTKLLLNMKMNCFETWAFLKEKKKHRHHHREACETAPHRETLTDLERLIWLPVNCLPFVNLLHRYKVLKEIAHLHSEIASLNAASEEQDAKIQKLDNLKTKFQNEKVWSAMLESAPQFVLQISIVIKKYLSGDLNDLYDPVTIFQICTSLMSVLMTTAGLITELPISGKVPQRSLVFTYAQIFPMVTLAVTPRLCTIAVIGSFATLENWVFYVSSFLLYSFCHSICCLLERLKRQGKNSHQAFIGYVTSLIAPCTILNLTSNFIVWTSLSSSVLLSIGLGSMLVFANYQPSMIFESDPSSCDSWTDTSYEEKTDVLEYYCMVLIPLLLFSNFIYYFIRKLVTKMNRCHLSIYLYNESQIAVGPKARNFR